MLRLRRGIPAVGGARRSAANCEASFDRLGGLSLGRDRGDNIGRNKISRARCFDAVSADVLAGDANVTTDSAALIGHRGSVR